MNFKDYLKDKILYIIIYFINTFLIITIMMLDLVINKQSIRAFNVLYSFILSIIFLGLIITVDYMRKKRFYNPLTKGLSKDHDIEYIFNIPDNISNEFKFVKKALVKNYNIYISILEKQKKTSETQMNFNNRWIHEMKTPVSIIKLILENEMHKSIDLNTKKNYESIQEEIERLTHGLEMALHTLRINDFELDFKVENVSLLDIVRTVINENKSAFIVNSIYPKVLSEEDIVVKSDKKWIKFIISQILTNSIKYSKVKENESKEITFELSKEDDKSIIAIQDRGVGIPKGDLERVFDPFFTGTNGRKFIESTGMGLYLSKDIAKRMGHDLQIESIEGEGTKVRVIFYDGKSIYNLENN